MTCTPAMSQVYKAVLRETGQEVAIKVQRPSVEPIIFRDLFLFRTLARFVTPFSLRKLGCNAELIVDEFGEKLLEELDYAQEARNIEVCTCASPSCRGRAAQYVAYGLRVEWAQHQGAHHSPSPSALHLL